MRNDFIQSLFLYDMRALFAGKGQRLEDGYFVFQFEAASRQSDPGSATLNTT